MKGSTALGAPLASVPTSHHSSKPMGTGCHHHHYHWDSLQGGKGEKPGPSLPLVHPACPHTVWLHSGYGQPKRGVCSAVKVMMTPTKYLGHRMCTGINHRHSPGDSHELQKCRPVLGSCASAASRSRSFTHPQTACCNCCYCHFYSHPRLFKLVLSDQAPALVFCWQRFSWSIIPFVLPALHFFIYIYI